MRCPDRHPKAPWLYEVGDLRAQGDPEVTVFLHDADTLIGLHIRGLETPILLGIREDPQGRPVSCAVELSVTLDSTTWQSNPRRVADEGEG